MVLVVSSGASRCLSKTLVINKKHNRFRSVDFTQFTPYLILFPNYLSSLLHLTSGQIFKHHAKQNISLSDHIFCSSFDWTYRCDLQFLQHTQIIHYPFLYHKLPAYWQKWLCARKFFYFTQNSDPLNYGMPAVLWGGGWVHDRVVGIATCCWMDVQASDPDACEGFSHHIHPDQPWGPPCLLYHVYKVSFMQLKWPGHNNPLSRALSLQVVDLYLYSPSVPPVTFCGMTSSLPHFSSSSHPHGATAPNGPGPPPYQGFTVTHRTR
jgi:hypothetical protein